MSGDRISLNVWEDVRRERNEPYRERYDGELAAGIRIERLRERLRHAEVVISELDARVRAARAALDRLRLDPERWENESDGLDHARVQLGQALAARRLGGERTQRLRDELDDALRRDALGIPPFEDPDNQ